MRPGDIEPKTNFKRDAKRILQKAKELEGLDLLVILGDLARKKQKLFLANKVNQLIVDLRKKSGLTKAINKTRVVVAAISPSPAFHLPLFDRY
jgi:Icc-related predicted phosphoesterase